MNDFLLNTNREIRIENGDIVIGPADEQNVMLHCELAKGEIKQYPFVGLDLIKKLKTVSNPTELQRDIKVALNNDGYTAAEVEIDMDSERFKIKI